MADLISRSALLAEYDRQHEGEAGRARKLMEEAPAIDAVEVQAYNELREDFVDYVCSGVPNPAPYCANASEKCVDRLGWCANGSDECKGFCPKHYGERKENETDRR